MTEWAFDTKAVHSGINPSQHRGATAVPIYETASFAYDSAEELADVFAGQKFGYVYTRIANPTVTAFEQRINSLENGVGAIAVSSGMAAITTVLLALTRQGDEIVSSTSLFGGTMHLFTHVLQKYGVRTRYVDPHEHRELRAALTDRTKLIFVETIGNPKLDIPDIRGIARLADERGIPLVVDGTLTTPYLFHARDYGVALIVHSATKFITGNGGSIGGVIVDLGNFDWQDCKDAAIRETAGKVGDELAFLAFTRTHILQNTGSCLSPFSAYLHCLGLETLPVRMDRHCSNAAALAQFLSNHHSVQDTNYPGLAGNRFYEIARSQFNEQFGSIIAFRLGSRERCFRFIDSLELVKNLANLGDAKTLVIHPASTIYRECTAEEMEQAGVSPDMVRVSVGIENIDDIIHDFSQALQGVDR